MGHAPFQFIVELGDLPLDALDQVDRGAELCADDEDGLSRADGIARVLEEPVYGFGPEASPAGTCEDLPGQRFIGGYAMYTRQSVSDTDEDLSSCDVQFALCSDFVRPMTAEGWVWIGERLDDVGYSGADRDRPALQRLLQLVREGALDKVVVYRLDSLTRGLLDSVAILDEFRKAGWTFFSSMRPDRGRRRRMPFS